jgi:ABC-type transporter Mla subunit MlaD
VNKDAKIGLLTLALALSVVLLNSLRDAGVVSFGSEIGLIFSQVQGLRAGDTVTIGGVPSGKVVSIDFASSETTQSLAPLTGGVALVEAKVAFTSNRKIPRDSTYAVRTDLNGRRWVEITLSPSDVEIGPNETFFAEQSGKQDDQLQTTINTFTLLGEQTEKLRDVLADPEFRLRTKDTASNLRFYSRELAAASAEAPALLKEFEKDLDTQESAILRQLQAFDDKTKDVRQRMTELSPQITENLQGWTERMSRQGGRLTSTLQMAIERSEEYQVMIDRSINDNLNPEAVQALIVQTKKWARKLEEYRYLAEDLHALTSDPTVRADLKAAIAKFEIKTVELNERLDKLEKQIDENPLKPMLGIPDVEIDDKVEGRPNPEASTPEPPPSRKPSAAATPGSRPEVEASPSDDESIFQR